jgi:hypothetical protein
MSLENDFLPFCYDDTGTNLESQSAYAADPNRTQGNQPGVASSQLVNKALRQATYVTANLAQYVSNYANVSMFDDATPAEQLSQMMGAFQPLSPVLTQLLSGTGTWDATCFFFVASANATAGATYTNNSVTFTVVKTISGGTILQTTGAGSPNASPASGGGTLSKASGTGDSSITYYAFRQALYANVRMVGGGGGGGGSGTGSGSAAVAGGNTTFGSSFLVANGGALGGANGAAGNSAGGSASVGAGAVAVISFTGGAGGSGGQGGGSAGGFIAGGAGGISAFGGAGLPGQSSAGSAGVTNSGSGGAGGTFNQASSEGSTATGGGGGAGGYLEALIYAPSTSYAYAVGAAGTAGTAGTSGEAGSAGGSGCILVTEYFQ